MSSSCSIHPTIVSISFLMQAIQELGGAMDDVKTIIDHRGQEQEVDGVIILDRERIGIKRESQHANERDPIKFVVLGSNTERGLKTIDRIRQSYARLKILDEVKRRGYSSIKEEKLADGSVRLVVQKWQ